MDSDTTVSEKTDIPQGAVKRVPDRLQQKFEALKKRRQEVCKRSTEKRVKQLQEDVLKRVEEEFTKEDLAMLREHNVVLPGNNDKKRKIAEYSGTDGNTSKEKPCFSQNDSIDESSGATVNATDWKDVQKYLGNSDHLKGTDRGKYAPKTKLHVGIEEAVSVGEFDIAEKLSDQLATREFGTKIAEAFDAKRYVDKREKEEETAKAKKKKRLHWGFEHKKRWETKSNM